MKSHKLAGKITISRIYGCDQDYIRITLKDESSKEQFINIDLTPEQLGQAITGLASVDCLFSVKNAEVVGKTKIRVYILQM